MSYAIYPGRQDSLDGYAKCNLSHSLNLGTSSPSRAVIQAIEANTETAVQHGAYDCKVAVSQVESALRIASVIGKSTLAGYRVPVMPPHSLHILSSAYICLHYCCAARGVRNRKNGRTLREVRPFSLEGVGHASN
jgi:hypothetical protein